jgi:hypothetical protein
VLSRQLVAIGYLELVARPDALPGGTDFSTLSVVSLVGTVLQLAWKGWLACRNARKANYYELIGNPNLHTELDLSLRSVELATSELEEVCNALGRMRNMRLRTLDLTGVASTEAKGAQLGRHLAKSLANLPELRSL